MLKGVRVKDTMEKGDNENPFFKSFTFILFTCHIMKTINHWKKGNHGIFEPSLTPIG